MHFTSQGCHDDLGTSGMSKSSANCSVLSLVGPCTSQLYLAPLMRRMEKVIE